jgi:DNA-binding transcriptional regulator YhcF (GntR family)
MGMVERQHQNPPLRVERLPGSWLGSVDSRCIICDSTRAVIPFHVEFVPGTPLYEQVVYAATRAIISGRLRPGDHFPSVRALSRELKINPNTAHKILTSLVDAGLLEIRIGSAPVVARIPASTEAEKSNLLQNEVEQLVVEAKRLGIDLEDIEIAVAKHWERLTSKRKEISDTKGGR